MMKHCDRIDAKSERLEIPGAVVERAIEPTTVEQVAAVVAKATADRTGLLLCGGRTRLHCANPAREISLALSIRGLSGVDEFEPDEGVLHAAAGTPIREIQRLVAAEGWELPLDPPGPNSTVGGVVASAATGPRAQAFGRVSNAVLGLDIVSAEGVISKCGGRVVKNVTGYDLAKLYCGSFGSLAVVTGAWLRLRPAPTVRRVFSARPASGREDFERCRSLSQLTSVRALVWCEVPDGDSPEITFELGGPEVGIAHDEKQFAQAFDLSEVPADRLDRLRDERAGSGGASIALAVRVLQTRAQEMLRTLLSWGLSVSVDPGLGVFHARGRLEDPKDLLAIRESAVAADGLATFEVLPEAWRGGVDVFGDADGTHALAASLKHRFDPAGILNPGRFAGGL